REVTRARGDDAALGLDRLDDQAARRAPLEHARGGLEVVVRDLLDRLDERAEAVAVLRLAGDGHCRHRTAVEAADRRHESRSLRRTRDDRLIATRELERAFVRLRAG